MAETDKSDAEEIPLLKPNQLPRRKKLSIKGLKAQQVINKYTVIASGIGFIPAPFAGQVAVGGLLVKYIKGYTPVLNSAGSLLLRPAISGLLVYYIGKLFLGHLESGAWLRVKEKGLRQFAKKHIPIGYSNTELSASIGKTWLPKLKS